MPKAVHFNSCEERRVHTLCTIVRMRPFTTLSTNTILSSVLSWIKKGLIRRGLDNVDVDYDVGPISSCGAAKFSALGKAVRL